MSGNSSSDSDRNGTRSTDGSASSTGEAFRAAIDQVVRTNLLKPGAGEAQIRERAQVLALAIGAATAAKDLAAREVFLDELCGLGHAGSGVVLAVEHLTAVRLDGLPDGCLEPRAVIAPAFTHAPVDGTDAQQKQYLSRREIITHIWTGKAAGLPTRYAHGMSQFTNSSVADIREMIIMMAQDVADRIERFVAWNGDGWGHLEDYRRAHPMPDSRLQR